MSDISQLSWEDRAKAAERTVDVLKAKVVAQYNGEGTAIARQLERARARDEENRRRRAVMEAKASELEKYSASLEQEVAKRTRDLKVILDNVTFGFLVIDRDLIVQDGYTASCSALLGRGGLAGVHVLDALGVESKRERDQYLLCADQVFEDLLPEELLLDQLPKRFEVGKRVLRVEGRTIRDDDNAVTGLLMTISDISALEAAERQSRMNKTLLIILKQREAFRHFIADTKAQLALAHESLDDQAYVRRVVHTIKGNSASYGLETIATKIHAIEDGPAISHGALDAIADSFRRFLDEHDEVLEIDFDETDEDVFQISSARMEELRAMIEAGTSPSELKRWTAEVYLKPASVLLGPFPLFVQKLSERLGKSIEFENHGFDVLVDAGTLQPIFQTLTHLVRNAVDHGIEPDGARGAKPKRGQLELSVRDEPEQWVLEMRDDGRGIDTDVLAVRAVAKGTHTQSDVDAMSHEQRLQLVFIDGVSSAERTTDISGRGVGMGAVRSEVERAEGSIDVSSERGKGTVFTIRVPKPDVLRQIDEAA